MAVVLKEKHSLIGRGILPVVMELKVGPPPSPPIARVKKDHPLEHYKLEELIQEFKRLTGEELTNVLTLAGKPTNRKRNLRFAPCNHSGKLQTNLRKVQD